MPENSINTPSKQHTRRRGRPSSVRASQSSMFIELDSDGEIMSSQPSDARPQEQDGWNQVVIEISSDEESSDEESFNDNSVDSCLTNKPSIPKQTQHLVAGSPSRSFESDTLKVLRAVLNENRTLKESLDKITADSISLDSHRMYMSCDICCEIMLLPYVISQCGHSFCANCLQMWFVTIKNEPQRARVGQLNDSPVPFQRTRLFRIPTPLPEYSCPSCRIKVITPPVQNYALTKLITSISNADGERAGKVVDSENGLSGLWNEFFP